MDSAPRVMVSSTFYDLHQLRSDLAHFISDQLGYDSLVSELPSFPVDPDLDTIENCRARVEKNADIFVLVIGGRYGQVDKQIDKSVTNLEYLTARAKGIPIYVFVDKSILAVFPVWKSNPEADYSQTVDTPRLFEFIDHVRNEERVWTFAFEKAQDIVDSLRVQFAYLFSDALRLRNRFTGSGLPPFLSSLGPKSLRIALEKPLGWEYRLFLQSWMDGLDSQASLLREYRVGLRIGIAESVPANRAGEWMSARMYELTGISESMTTLVNQQLLEAFGKDGEPGDVEKIVWVSSMLDKAVESALNWALRVRCASIEEPFDSLAPELALFMDDLINEIVCYPKETLSLVEEALCAPRTGKPRIIEHTLKLRLSNTEKFYQELDKVKRFYGLRG